MNLPYTAEEIASANAYSAMTDAKGSLEKSKEALKRTEQMREELRLLEEKFKALASTMKPYGIIGDSNKKELWNVVPKEHECFEIVDDATGQPVLFAMKDRIALLEGYSVKFEEGEAK